MPTAGARIRRCWSTPPTFAVATATYRWLQGVGLTFWDSFGVSICFTGRINSLGAGFEQCNGHRRRDRGVGKLREKVRAKLLSCTAAAPVGALSCMGTVFWSFSWVAVELGAVDCPLSAAAADISSSSLRQACAPARFPCRGGQRRPCTRHRHPLRRRHCAGYRPQLTSSPLKRVGCVCFPTGEAAVDASAQSPCWVADGCRPSASAAPRAAVTGAACSPRRPAPPRAAPPLPRAGVTSRSGPSSSSTPWRARCPRPAAKSSGMSGCGCTPGRSSC